jgi:succinate dehydrogenase / fumarate reductase flavoprotein subunit
MSKLDSKIPAGPLKDKWKNHKDHMNLVAPNNRDKIDIIVVGTGLQVVLLHYLLNKDIM